MTVRDSAGGIVTLVHVYYIVRLLRQENERLMTRGHQHMTVDEMRFVIAGVLGPQGGKLFDVEVEQLSTGGAR